MRTLVLLCVLMVAVSVTHGRREAGRRAERNVLSQKNDYALKEWIAHSFDKQLSRFLKMTKGWLRISRTQVRVLQYMNRRHMVRNCDFYRKHATDTLLRHHLRLTERNYKLMGRRIGRQIQMGWRYYRMLSKKQLPKFTKSIKRVLTKWHNTRAFPGRLEFRTVGDVPLHPMCSTHDKCSCDGLCQVCIQP